MMPYDEWVLPLFRNLRRDGAGLGEIRFKANDVEQRPIGFRSGPTQFTLVLCATEKNDDFVPANSVAVAQARKTEILEGKGSTNAIWLAFQ
jgi:hypothetical protein